MTIEDDTAAADAVREAAELESGFTDKAPEKPAAKAEAPDAAAAVKVEAPPPPPPPPKYVRLTESEVADLRAAASKTASFDRQLSQVHGHYGKMKERLDAFLAQGAPRGGGKIAISKAAFAEMEKDFPELAQQVHAAMEGALSGMSGNSVAEVDEAAAEALSAARAVKREVAALEREHPDWKAKINAVNVNAGQQPDPNHPFRKWLATKPAGYQKRINNTESATQLMDAIDLFETESKAPLKPAAPTPQAAARAAVMRGAIPPRGDGGAAGASAGKTENDELLEGFNSR